jgi:hypothetical protein
MGKPLFVNERLYDSAKVKRFRFAGFAWLRFWHTVASIRVIRIDRERECTFDHVSFDRSRIDKHR